MAGRRGESSPRRRDLALATEQHGVVAYWQLRACGLSAEAIEHRIGCARLARLYRAVYATGHRAVGFEGRLLAAALAIGSGAFVSQDSAARLLDVLPAGTPKDVGLAPVDVSVVGGRNVRRRDGIRVHRSTGLDRRDLRWIGPIPVSAGGRTVLAVADEGDTRTVERMLASVLRARLATESEVRSLLSRSPGRAGIGIVARLIDGEPAFDRSVAERMLLELVRRAGLPEPRMNARAGDFEVDGLWAPLGVIVEFESFTFHGDRFAFRRDNRKRARLQAHGHDVVPVVWEDLVDAPETVVATLAAVLAVARDRRR